LFFPFLTLFILLLFCLSRFLSLFLLFHSPFPLSFFRFSHPLPLPLQFFLLFSTVLLFPSFLLSHLL
jgi:hypothetical protein